MDRYQVLEFIGEGTFGKVYKGRRVGTGQFVALKLQPLTLRGTMREEVAVLRSLDHENVVQLLDYFETDADLVVVTEYAHAELFTLLRDDKVLPEETAQLLVLQLTRALAYLHARRVMHRDIKPENVLIGSPVPLHLPRPDGSSVSLLTPRVILSDFGLASQLSHARASPQPGGHIGLLSSFKGSPCYMSPERFKDNSYSTAADVWGLGVLAYEVLSGAPPFIADTLSDLVRVLTAHTDPLLEGGGALPWPQGLSVDAKAFIAACLARDARNRPTAEQLLQHAWLTQLHVLRAGGADGRGQAP